MIRTQIQLTEDQARRLRALAQREAVSLAEVIRRFVDDGLEKLESDPLEVYARARGLIGRFADKEGAKDLAAEHDRYLADSLE